MIIKTYFEYLGIDNDFPGSKIYEVLALTVTRTRNGRYYSRPELEAGARSLSWRPLNINHDRSRVLPFPQNSTLPMEFNATKMGVMGKIRVTDETTQKKIESGKINRLSVEQIPVKGEDCTSNPNGPPACTEKGVVFTAMALLEYDVPAGDESTRIYVPGMNTESVMEELPFQECLACQKGEKLKPHKFIPKTNNKSECQECGYASSNVIHTSESDDPLKPDNLNSSIYGNAPPPAKIVDLENILGDLGNKEPPGFVSDDPVTIPGGNGDTNNGSLDLNMEDKQAMKNPKEDDDEKKAEDAILTVDGKIGTAAAPTGSVPPSVQSATAGSTPGAVADTSNLRDITTLAGESGKLALITFTPQQWAEYQKSSKENTEALKNAVVALTESMKTLFEQKTKTEASSQVDDSKYKTQTESYNTTTEFFSESRTGTALDLARNKWTLDKEMFLEKGGYKQPGKIFSGLEQFKKEAVTVTAGDMGQVFSKQIFLIPGGRTRTPVRQFCNFIEIPNSADRANWYTIGAFAYGTITEGTEPTNVSQTVTKIQATPIISGAVQRVGYSQIENAPFGLIDSINMAHLLAALDYEATEILSTIANAGSYTPTNWINGNTATAITTDDAAAVTTMTGNAVAVGKRLIAAQGYDISPGNLVLFLSPKAYYELITDAGLVRFLQFGMINATLQGVLEQLFGVDIVVATQVPKVANTTYPVYRNVMAVKGLTFGLCSAREVTLEAQRRNEVQQVILSGMQRIKGALLQDLSLCRISTSQ